MKVNEKILEEIKKMYEEGLSYELIRGTISTRYNVNIAKNTIKTYANKYKWVRSDKTIAVRSVDELKNNIMRGIEQIELKLKEEPEVEEILKGMANLFNYAYKELIDRVSKKEIAMGMEIDDLIKIIKTSAEALYELKKINKQTGNVYIEFNVDLSFDRHYNNEKVIEKVIEVKKENEYVDAIDVVRSEGEKSFEDIFDRLEKVKKGTGINKD